MDKRKVKELIQEVIRNNVDSLEFGSDKHNAPLRKANTLLHDALIELSKSDWISVEERLPEYGEKVYVKSERSPHLIQTHREDFDENDGKFHPFRNKNKFILEKGIYGNITHWKPIEKLED